MAEADKGMAILFENRLNELKAEREFEEMRNLIPRKGLSGEQRRAVNDLVRKKLSTVCNRTVFWLALNKGHQLSLKELASRLENHRFNDLRELFELMVSLMEARETKIIRKLFGVAFDEAKRVGLAVQPMVISNEIKFFLRSIIYRSGIFEEIICARPDGGVLLKKLEEANFGSELRLRHIRERFENVRGSR